jgi:flagellar basal-body rod protein FlgC
VDVYSKTLAAAMQGIRANATRVRIAAENMANAKTPGYQRKIPVFQDVVDSKTGAKGVKVDRVELDPSDPLRAYEPSHPLADDAGYVTYSNVQMFAELADAREAQRSYEANIQSFDQARRMYSRVLEILKR